MDFFNTDVIVQYWPVFLRGLAMTVGLTIGVFILASFLAIPVALMRLSRKRLLSWPSYWFVEIFRATPLILQLIYIYYVLPSAGIELNPLAAATVGLTLHYAAYMSEVYRAGIQSVPVGQTEAAESLGIRGRVIFFKIVLPQAFRLIVPALGNYLISLFKDTALASVVTVKELMFSGQIIAARNYQYFTIYTITGILYFGVGYPSSRFVAFLERWSQRGWASY